MKKPPSIMSKDPGPSEEDQCVKERRLILRFKMPLIMNSLDHKEYEDIPTMDEKKKRSIAMDLLVQWVLCYLHNSKDPIQGGDT